MVKVVKLLATPLKFECGKVRSLDYFFDKMSCSVNLTSQRFVSESSSFHVEGFHINERSNRNFAPM